MNSNTSRGVRAATLSPGCAGDAPPSEHPAPATARIVPLRRPAQSQSPAMRSDDPGDDPGPQAA